jgi:hypothetical protein
LKSDTERPPMWKNVTLALGIVLLGQFSHAQQEFAKLVGNTSVQPVAAGSNISVPYITWGGDAATFLANGGLKTASGSIYQGMGLQMQLTAGDDFVGQVKSYMAGKSPFLRGTLHMLGQASEVIAGSHLAVIVERGRPYRCSRWH